MKTRQLEDSLQSLQTDVIDLVRDDHSQAWTWDSTALFSDVGESL